MLYCTSKDERNFLYIGPVSPLVLVVRFDEKMERCAMIRVGDSDLAVLCHRFGFPFKEGGEEEWHDLSSV